MTKARAYSFLVLLLLVPAAGLRAATTPEETIWRPRLVTPAIVAMDSAADREFVAEVRMDPSSRDWKATIANDLRSWPCEVVSTTYGKINRNTEAGWQIRIRVPGDAPPELFDLTVSSSEGSHTQNQSVSITPNFTSDFYILHIADEQIVNEQHTDPSGQYYRTVGTVEEMKWMQQPVNLIHPRFVFITGDQIDYNGALDGWNNWHNWGYEPGGKKHFSKQETIDIEKRLSEMYIDCHRGYRVPYVEAPGNHDVTPTDKKLLDTGIFWHPISVQMYEKYFGQRSWSFRMGDFYVLLHDWSERELKEWAAAEYDAAMNDPSIKFRLVGQHFNADQAFVSQQCDLMLIGHGHAVKTVQTTPYYIYMDGPAFVYGTTGFFNFRRKSQGGWTCDQTASPRDASKDVWRLFTDHGEKNLIRADQPDSMNVTTRSITITNELPVEFYDGRVRFVLQKGSYQSIKNGKILAEYDNVDGTKTAVLVQVAIPAKDSIIVTLDH